MRYVIDIKPTDDDRVEGVVVRDGSEHGVGFSGWTELMSLLEPPPWGRPWGGDRSLEEVGGD